MQELEHLLSVILALLLLSIIPVKLYFDQKISEAKRIKRFALRKTDAKYEEFQKIYDKVCKSEDIVEIEKMRKRIKSRIIIGVFICLCVMVISCFLYVKADDLTSEENVMYVSMLLIIAIATYTYKKVKAKFSLHAKQYKEKIFSGFVKLVDENLEYKHTCENSKYDEEAAKLYKDAEFDLETVDIVRVDDYLYGTLNQKHFRFFDLSAIKINYQDGKRYEYSTFTGLFCFTRLENIIPAEIKMLNTKLPRRLDEYIVELETSDFSKNFIVYSNNKILATRIFTADTMHMLNDYSEKFEMKFEFVIKDLDLYMRFNSGDMFAPYIFKKSTDEELLYFYYYTLCFARDLSEKINEMMRDIDF